MSAKNRGRISPSGSQNLFARLLAIWIYYRRPILITAILTVLISLLSSLHPATRRSLWVGFLAQRELVILLLVFSLLTLSLLWSAGQAIDTRIFLLLNLRGFHPRWLDRLMWAATQIGNGVAGILLSVILFFSGNRPLAVELILGILTLWLTVELVKALVERSRPFLVLETARVIGWKEWGKSFPSGHTAQAFFMMALLAQHFRVSILVAIFLYAIALLVGLTRIYVGAHYPRDVIGGAVLGSVWGILAGLVETYISTRAI